LISPPGRILSIIRMTFGLGGVGLSQDQIHRVGIGTDLHRLVSGRPLWLGGVEIPFALGLLGHSDGDVVFHAVIDAICGAAGLPDIGDHFPDTDARYKDCDSGILLSRIVDEIAALGYAVVNVDVVIGAEKPKLTSYKEAIGLSLAERLGIEAGCVGVKAKTAEGMGAVGRGEAITCMAIVGLARRTL